jgi:8-oxo-dGTP pyrophosphatase MutT (NUDIX family)
MEPWERDGVKPEDQCSSVILVRVYAEGEIGVREHLLGYVFVIEPDLPNAMYKMPGGRREPGENPAETALRELEGETGLRCRPESLHYLDSEWKRTHWNVLFAADMELSAIRLMNSCHHENEGEVPKYFTCARLYEELGRGMVLRPHGDRLQRLRLI